MTNIAVIENKISSARKYLTILQRYQDRSEKEIEDNLDIRGAVERYLYLAIQATIDLAEAVISWKNFRKPSTMAESFHILNEENIIDSTLKTKMSGMVGFRNIIAHDYEDINYGIVVDVLNNGLADIDEFLGRIADINF